MKLNVLAEDGNLVLGRGDDPVRTLGEMLILANYTDNLAKEILFVLLEQFRNAIQADAYVMAYRREEKNGEQIAVPVGFFTLAWVSEPVDALFKNGFRALTPDELHSGPRFRVNFSVFPYTGYFEKALPLLWAAYPKETEFGYMKLKENRSVMHFMRRK